MREKEIKLRIQNFCLKKLILTFSRPDPYMHLGRDKN